jgi:REP element-mobilizing transposase RayT
MILAHHCIFSMYGFWLPNDPRGSGSDYIAAWDLFRYGPATKTNSRKSVAARPHDRAWRMRAKEVLKYPPVKLTGIQAVTIVKGFRKACEEGDYKIHALSVLPDHIHLVVGRHQRWIRQIVGHLKSRATRALKEHGLWFADNRPVWGEHGWNVFLDNITAVERAIRYVEQNPIKEGKKPQTWSLVTPFDPSASQATRRNNTKPRRLGGAALRSSQLKRNRKPS